MSNEIYCEVIGQMTLTIPVKIRLTVRGRGVRDRAVWRPGDR
jgi:hypothetical protein